MRFPSTFSSTIFLLPPSPVSVSASNSGAFSLYDKYIWRCSKLSFGKSSNTNINGLAKTKKLEGVGFFFFFFKRCFPCVIIGIMHTLLLLCQCSPPSSLLRAAHLAIPIFLTESGFCVMCYCLRAELSECRLQSLHAPERQQMGQRHEGQRAVALKRWWRGGVGEGKRGR